jgi:hypothetical protein
MALELVPGHRVEPEPITAPLSAQWDVDELAATWLTDGTII